MFPLDRGRGLLVRVFPFNVHENTIMDEELFGHGNITVIQLNGSDLIGLPLLSTAHKILTDVLLQSL